MSISNLIFMSLSKLVLFSSSLGKKISKCFLVSPFKNADCIFD